MVGLHLFSHSFCRFNICQTDGEREGQQMLFLLLREGPTKDVMIVETREREGGQIEKFSVGGSLWKDTSDMFERGSEGGKNSIFLPDPLLSRSWLSYGFYMHRFDKFGHTN